MSVKIRLTRHGRKKAPYYRMVVADSRKARDGRFIEILGIYQPLNKNEADQIRVNETKVMKWLEQGAVPSDTCRSILRKQGIMKKFHDVRQEAKKGKKSLRLAKTEETSAAPAEEIDSDAALAPEEAQVSEPPVEAEPVASEAPETEPKTE